MSRILVIDDDEAVREMICEMLADAGHDVVSACDGADGLGQLEGGAVDLVITDIIMPKKEGFETIYELQTGYPDLPILAVSGGSPKGMGSYLPSAKALGATRTLAKPFTEEDLLAAVNGLLDRSAGSRG